MQNSKLVSWLFWTLTLLGLMPKMVFSATIFSTMGPVPYASNSHSSVVSWDYNPGLGGGFATGLATPFSFLGSAYGLDSITLDIGLDRLERVPNLQIGIFADDGGRPSLMPITFLEPTPSLVSIYFDRRLTTYSFSGQTILSPNTTYWLAVQPHTVGTANENHDAGYVISQSVLPLTVPFLQKLYDEGAWSDWAVLPNTAQPVFRLDGTAVPEPGTWALLGLGSALFWCATRRRRK